MPAGYCGSVAAIWGWMPEACPATCAPLCAGTHGAKLVPSAPYEPAHHAPMGAAWAKAITGMTSATAANATIPVHLMSLSVGLDSLHSTASYRPDARASISRDPEIATRVPGPVMTRERQSGADLEGKADTRTRPFAAATAGKCHRSVPV